MKTAQDPRHQRRIDLMQKLFAASFGNEPDYEVQTILQTIDIIDPLIHQAAPEWPIEKIAKLDLAILRLAVYELKIRPEEPPKVVIDEAVELAKSYGSPTSAGFINGALGAVLSIISKTSEEQTH